MKDIVQLEIDNIVDDFKQENFGYGIKEEYYDFIVTKLDDVQDWKSIDRSFLGDYEGDEDEAWWDFKDNHTVDELLEVGFRKYPNEFIRFQKRYKNSLYNQTLKKHNFKDLDYKDIVPNLSQEQKDKIIKEILNQDIYLGDEGYTAEIKKLKKLDKNKWVLTQTPWEWNNPDKTSPVKKQYFKNDEDLIVYFMEDNRGAHEILNWTGDSYLNPHYQVNQWIVTNYELELAQTEELEQTQKFEEPKMKM
ncbi:hypothetical protein R7W80_03215 [Mesomycoplasma ovipneumoniae]|uniref:hypothetical protein n=1 Tax=Mesomycoplasma ovipneumoniae TaxID=29562 RepID=UPI0028B1B899|nr:hypothetical protein [Mesomycoplasma ovipneumoniae]MDW2910177.1 hypothetical protein [Mesomycoplasma ovipneumoniae]WNM17512.1 hypothetical protein RNM28_00975 [Mesomycoplasma ovipneumoniae]